MIPTLFRKHLAAGILAALLSTGCAMTPTSKKAPDEPLRVDKAAYEFGYAGPEQTIRHEFAYANESAAAVSIAHLSVCCGCRAETSTKIEEPIAPGQGGKILVTCVMPRYEGSVEKVVMLNIASEAGAEIPLTISGKVSRDIVLVPSALSFGQLKKGEVVQKRLRVYQMSDKRLIVDKVIADQGFYSVQARHFDELNHRGYDIIVDFEAKVGAGPHSDVITLYTNDRRRPRIDVPVVAQVVD